MTLEEKVLAHRLFVMRRAQELESVTEVYRQLGLSRTLFYRGRRRYLREGADSLKSRPPRRARLTQHAPAAVEAARLAYARLWPSHGPADLRLQVRLLGGGAPGSVSSRDLRPDRRAIAHRLQHRL